MEDYDNKRAFDRAQREYDNQEAPYTEYDRVEDLMLNGDCDDCDQDPTECLNLGYCKREEE